MTPPATITLQRDTPVGTILYDNSQITDVSEVSCNGVFPYYRGYKNIISSDEVPGMQHVYRTNNPGIGVRAWYSNNNNVPLDLYTLGPYISVGNTSYSRYFIPAKFRMQLIVIGQPDNTTLNLSKFNAELKYGSLVVSEMIVKDVNISVITQTCDVSAESRNLTVSLGTVDKNKFGTVGSKAGTTPFNIAMSCVAGTNVNMTFDGMTQNGDDSILILDDAEDQITATGVGTQISYKGNVIKFRDLIPIVQNVSEGFLSIPFEVQYIKTQNNIKAGKANSTTTFTMTYR